MRLDEMTLQTFEPLIGSNFTISFSDHDPIQIKLTGVAPVMERVRSKKLKRQPFVIYFEAPDSFFLPQQMYDFSHEALGESVPIFIVPTGRENGCFQYEAVFT